MISSFLTTAIFVSMSTGIVQAQDVIPLDSGQLQAAYFIKDAKATKVSAFLVLPYGEFDNPYAEGLAHYTEHLVWLNAFGQAKANFARDDNASTGLFRIEYHFSSPANELRQSLTVLKKTLSPTQLDQEFMEQERGIVAREYDLGIRESIWHDFDREQDHALFGNHPITRSVIGVPADINRFSIADAKRFQQKTHNAEHAVLLVFGNSNAQEVQTALTAVFGGSNTAAPLPPHDFDFAPIQQDIKSVRVERSDRQMVVISKPVHLQDPMPYQRRIQIALLLRRALLSTYEGSLAKPLRFDDFIARSIRVHINFLDQNDLVFTLEAEPDLDVSLQQLRQKVQTTLSKIAQQGIPPETLRKIRQQYLTQLRQIENPAQQVSSDALEDIAARQTPIGFDDLLALIEDIQPAEINRFLTQITQPGPRIVRLVNTPKGENN